MTERYGAHAQRDGVLMYATAALLFSIGGVVAKTVMQSGVVPIEFAPIRALFAAVLLLVWVGITNPRALRVTKHEAPRLAVYGMGIFFMTQLLYMTAINNLPVAIGTILAFMAIMNVAIWNWLRHGRRLDIPTSVAIALSLVGALFITGLVTGRLSGNITVFGIVAGIGCSIALTAYWLVGGSLQRNRDATSLLMWAMIGIVASWSVVKPWWNYPWHKIGGSTPAFIDHGPVLPVWLLVLFVAVVGTAVPFGLTLASVARIGAQRAGIVGSLEPAFAAVIAYIALGEALGILQVIGGALILSGIFVVEYAALRAHRDDAVA